MSCQISADRKLPRNHKKAPEIGNLTETILQLTNESKLMCGKAGRNMSIVIDHRKASR